MEKKDVLAALSGLSQETRLDIFRLLVGAGPAGMAAGALADALELPPATLSFHLKEMRHAGLAQSRREGRSIIYVADFPTMEGLVAFLTDNCCRSSGGACITQVDGSCATVGRASGNARAMARTRRNHP